MRLLCAVCAAVVPSYIVAGEPSTWQKNAHAACAARGCRGAYGAGVGGIACRCVRACVRSAPFCTLAKQAFLAACQLFQASRCFSFGAHGRRGRQLIVCCNGTRCQKRGWQLLRRRRWLAARAAAALARGSGTLRTAAAAPSRLSPSAGRHTPELPHSRASPVPQLAAKHVCAHVQQQLAQHRSIPAVEESF